MTFHEIAHTREIYNGRMTTPGYIHNQKAKVADVLNYYQLENVSFIFRHDNDPKYIIKYTIIYRKEKGKYLVLPCSSRSPPLIEPDRAHMKMLEAETMEFGVFLDFFFLDF